MYTKFDPMSIGEYPEKQQSDEIADMRDEF